MMSVKFSGKHYTTDKTNLFSTYNIQYSNAESSKRFCALSGILSFNMNGSLLVRIVNLSTVQISCDFCTCTTNQISFDSETLRVSA